MKASERYDIEKGKWTRLDDMLTPRKSACSVIMPDGIYVIGGYDGNSYLKSCEKYDFNSKKWKNIPAMNYPRSHFSCNVSADCNYLYAIGGFDGKSMNIIERFDVLLSKWEVVAKIPGNKYRHQSILYQY